MSTGSVLSSRPSLPEPTSRPGFVDVEKLRNSDDIVAVISQRSSNGKLTFGFFREFPRDGAIGRTGFIPEELGESYLRLVQDTIRRCAELKASGALPYPTR